MLQELGLVMGKVLEREPDVSCCCFPAPVLLSFCLVFVRRGERDPSCQPSSPSPCPYTLCSLLPEFYFGGHWSRLDLPRSVTPSHSIVHLLFALRRKPC